MIIRVLFCSLSSLFVFIFGVIRGCPFPFPAVAAAVAIIFNGTARANITSFLQGALTRSHNRTRTTAMDKVQVAGIMFGDDSCVDCVILSYARGTQSMCKQKTHQTYNRNFEVYSYRMLMSCGEEMRNLCVCVKTAMSADISQDVFPHP